MNHLRPVDQPGAYQLQQTQDNIFNKFSSASLDKDQSSGGALRDECCTTHGVPHGTPVS
jgi:hypothetical protein